MRTTITVASIIVWLIVSACGGTHGNMGKYWVEGSPDEVYEALRNIAIADSVEGITLVTDHDYAGKPYLEILVGRQYGYEIKGITMHVTPISNHNGKTGCWVGLVFIRRMDDKYCRSGTCEMEEERVGREAAIRFLLTPLKQFYPVEL